MTHYVSLSFRGKNGIPVQFHNVIFLHFYVSFIIIHMFPCLYIKVNFSSIDCHDTIGNMLSERNIL